MTYRHLSDAEFVRRAHLEIDPLVTTDLERELLARFERHLDAAEIVSLLAEVDIESPDELRPVVDVQKAYGHLAVGELLQVLCDHDIHEPSVLRRELRRAERVTTLVGDIAGPLTQLQQALEAEE